MPNVQVNCLKQTFGWFIFLNTVWRIISTRLKSEIYPIDFSEQHTDGSNRTGA